MNWLWDLILEEGAKPPTNGMILMVLLYIVIFPILGALYAGSLSDSNKKEIVVCTIIFMLITVFLLWLAVGKSFWWSAAIGQWLAQ